MIQRTTACISVTLHAKALHNMGYLLLTADIAGGKWHVTCFLDAFTGLVHIWQSQSKVTKPSAQIIAILAIVLSQLQGKVCVLRAKAQERIGVLLLHAWTDIQTNCENLVR